jgi:hypothetical protein
MIDTVTSTTAVLDEEGVEGNEGQKEDKDYWSSQVCQSGASYVRSLLYFLQSPILLTVYIPSIVSPTPAFAQSLPASHLYHLVHLPIFF